MPQISELFSTFLSSGGCFNTLVESGIVRKVWGLSEKVCKFFCSPSLLLG